MKILVATHNEDKVKEIKEILSDIDIVSLKDLNDFTEVEENGDSLKANARLKAEYFFKKYNVPTISDDSGLFVECLGGAPGVRSGRYSDEGTYEANVDKLLKEMEGKTDRSAYFETVVCYIDKDAFAHYFSGKIDGDITLDKKTSTGFGYDPVFIPDGLYTTFSQMPKEDKNLISHRGQAFTKLHNYIKEKSWNNMVVFYSNDILGKENSKIVRRLLGGMSNYTYVIESDDELYTIRFLGEYAEEFVDRKCEALNTKLMEKLGVSNKTIYFDITSGIKMCKYVEGTPLSEMDNIDYPLEDVANLLKVIHGSSELAENDYDPFLRLEKYEKLLIDLNYDFPNEYLDLKKTFLSYKEYLDNQKKVLCHGDSQPSNFILDDKLYIVDFEFVGNCDPIYDIACFANMRLIDGLKLLEVYYKDKLDNDKYKRFYLWRAYQAAQWFNVALFKHMKGMSETLKIPFDKVAFNYLKLFKDMIDEASKY